MNASQTVSRAALLLIAALAVGCPSPNDDDGGGGGGGGGSNSGSLVAEFGGGVEWRNPSEGNDEATVVVADDEHFYVAGTKRGTGTSSEVSWQIEKRWLVDGHLVTLDESDPSNDVDEPRAMALDATHVYVAGTAGGAWYVEKRWLTSMTLDASFGTAGAVTGISGFISEGPRGIAIDGTHMYLVGTASSQWRIEKRDLDSGALETLTFGGGTGFVTVDPSGLADDLTAITVDGTHMYVAGTAGQAWRVEKRSLVTGDLETTTFGGATGAVTSDPGVGDDRAVSIALDGTHFYVAGYETIGIGDRRWRVEKRDLATGALETGTFGGATGIVTSDPGAGQDEPAMLFLEPGASPDSFFVLGTDASGASAQWRMEKRSLSTGDLDPAFGTAGVESEDPSPGEDRPLAVATTPEHFIAVGFDSTPGNRQWRIEGRSLADGSHGLFGNAGFVTFDPSSGDDVPLSIAIDSTNMYVLGNSFANRRLLVFRKSDGAQVAEEVAAATDMQGVRVEGDALYLFRLASDSAVRRVLLPDLVLDPGFGTGGTLTTNSEFELKSFATDSSYAYLGGVHIQSGFQPQRRVEKRSLLDGSLDSGFGDSGGLEGTNGTYLQLTAMAADATSLYFQAGTRLAKVYRSNGAPVSAFGTGGVLIESTVMGGFTPTDISLHGDSLYVAGHPFGDLLPHHVVKRSAADGSRDTGFGSDGVLTLPDFDGSAVSPGRFAADGSSIYVVGEKEGAWRIEKRRASDGRPSRDFGSDGVVTSDPSPSPESAIGMAIDSEYLYVIGTDKTDGDSRWRIEKRRK